MLGPRQGQSVFLQTPLLTATHTMASQSLDYRGSEFPAEATLVSDS